MSITASQYLNNSNTEKFFTGVFHYTRPVRSKHSSSVEIYGLLSVSSEVEIPSANIAKFAWDGLVDGFEYSNTDSTNDALKTALVESTRRIKQLIVNDKNISTHGVDINFAVFVSGSSGMYVGCLGECDIYVYKKDRFVDISEMLAKKNAKTAGLILDADDLLFTSTKGFFKRNFKRLVSLVGRNAILKAFDSITKDLESGEGVLILTNEVAETKTEEVKPKIRLEVPKEVAIPSSIPETPEEKVSKKSDIDLRTFVASKKNALGDSLRRFFLKLKGIIAPLKEKLPNIKIKIKNPFPNLGLRVKDIFGKKRWFKQISAKVSQSDIKMSARNQLKGFRVDGYKAKNKKIERFRIAFFILFGIVVVVLGIKFTMDQKEARSISKEANGIFATVEGYVKEAEEKARTDKDTSETLLFKAQEELAKVPEDLGEKDLEKFNTFETKVLEIQDGIYNRTGLVDSDSSIETYVDSRLAFGEGSKPTDIAIYQDSKSNEYLLVADPALKGVFRISLYDKEVKRLPDTENLLQKPSMIYIGESGLFVLDLEAGVFKAEFDSEGWFTSFVKLTGLGIENIGAEDIAEFAVLTEADNVYILDRAQGALLKSSNFGSGYGLSFPYIKDDSFMEANDILADLSTYILTSGPQGIHMYRYSYFESKQIPATLEILGLNGEFKNLTYGYTRLDLNFDLYLYDSEDKRIMRFEKPIEGGGEIRHPNQAVLKEQYVYRGTRENVFNDVKDFVVNRDQKSLYLLDSSTIWKVRL